MYLCIIVYLIFYLKTNAHKLSPLMGILDCSLEYVNLPIHCHSAVVAVVVVVVNIVVGIAPCT